MVKDAPVQGFGDKEEEERRPKPRSASEKNRREERRGGASPSSSNALSKRSFLDGLKRRTRSRSGDNLFQDEGGALRLQGWLSGEREVNEGRRTLEVGEGRKTLDGGTKQVRC